MTFPVPGYETDTIAAADGMVFCYPMDEASGATAADAVGSLDLTIAFDGSDLTSGATGKFDLCRDFGQADSSSLSLTGTEAGLNTTWSVSFWVRVADLSPAADRKLVSIQKATSDTRIDIYYDSSNFIRAVAKDTTGQFLADGTTSLSVDTWYSVIYTSTAAGTGELYLNNSSEDTTTGTGLAITGFDEIRIGDNGGLIDCRIDDVGLWDRVLDSTDRARIYNSGTGVELLSEARQETLTEDLECDEAPSQMVLLPNTLSTTFNLSQTLASPYVGVPKTLTETVEFSETLNSWYGALLTEALQLTVSLQSQGTLSQPISETLELQEAIQKGMLGALTDTVEFSETRTRMVVRLKTIYERLAIADSRASRADLGKTIADALSFTELLKYGDGAALADTLEFSELLSVDYHLNELLAEALNVSADQTPHLGVMFTQADGVEFGEAVATNTTVQELLQDGVSFGIYFTDGNESYTGWVMNTKNFGVSTYSNYGFNSFHKAFGSYLAASSTGLYRLEGDDDDGTEIATVLASGMFAPGGSYQSRMEVAWLGCRSDGTVVLKMTTGEDIERWYESTATHSGADTLRVKLSRGDKSRYWKYELVNTSGNDIELDSIELLPVVLTRRV